MKRRLLTVLFALLLLLLCGCAALVPSEYTLVTPHNPGTKTEQQSDVLTVSNYKMLKNALRTLVQNGVEHGVIHTSQYEADIEADLPQAVYEIAREDPIGAYAIDYITHDCTLIVAYYEIKVDITFRDVLTPLDEIEYVGGETEAGRLISRALEDYDDHLTLYATYPGRPDYAALVQNYCDSHLREHAAEPELTVSADGTVSGPEEPVYTKNEQGDKYGLREASALHKEWYEHAEGYCSTLKGKTMVEIAAQPTDGSDADLKALCTISVTDLQKAVLAALAET